MKSTFKYTVSAYHLDRFGNLYVGSESESKTRLEPEAWLAKYIINGRAAVRQSLGTYTLSDDSGGTWVYDFDTYGTFYS